MTEVLVAGVYLADRPNTAAHIVYECAGARRVRATQRWVALAPSGTGDCDLPGTVAIQRERTPKFLLLNALTTDAARFDWILLMDDDVELPPGFLDRFIAVAEACDFALCQPARTADSYIDHPIVMENPGVSARRTRFVEIGPVTAIRRDAAALILPVPEDCGMGWGLDYVWPQVMEEAGLKMGVVDATPIAHRMRRQVSGYGYDDAARAMFLLMARHRHLTREDAFQVLDVHV
ncbi:hypothetical protein [Acidisoma sp. 7E03]